MTALLIFLTLFRLVTPGFLIVFSIALAAVFFSVAFCLRVMFPAVMFTVLLTV